MSIEPVDPFVSQLVKMFAQAVVQLEQILAEAVSAGRMGSARYKRARIYAIQSILQQLHAEAIPIAEYAIRESFRVGWGRAGMEEADMVGAFGVGVNLPAIEIITKNLDNSLTDAINTVGRKADDAIRRATIESVAEHMIGGSTYGEARKQLKQKLLANGTTGFVDKAGRRWTLDTYAEMAIRTTTREADSKGAVNGIQMAGNDLVTISKHLNSCVICQPFEGNTYSITGSTPGYEKLEQIPPFHPQCSHVVGPAVATFEQRMRELQAVLA